MRAVKIVLHALALVPLFFFATVDAQSIPPSSYGPYNAVFRPGGNGLRKSIDATDTLFQATSPWSMYCWFHSEQLEPGSTLLAGVGNPLEEYSRYFGLRDGNLVFRMGEDNSLSAPLAWQTAAWHFAAATFDGVLIHLYSDGREVSSGKLVLGRVSQDLQMAPEDLPWTDAKHFGGKIAGMMLLRTTLSAEEIRQVYTHAPDFSLAEFEEGSKPWPVQTRAQAGYRAPQDPASLPRSAAPFSSPTVRPLPPARTSLEPRGENHWALEGGWKLTPAPKVIADGAIVSQAGFDTKEWWPATVPGTVLTTMVDRGVYPDPDYGLNNLAIPESLNKQDYWYRAEFRAPKSEG